MKHWRLPTGRVASTDAGFTLIELVVSMGIFAIIAMLAYGGLRNVLDGQGYAEQKAVRMARLQLVYRLMERDMQQIVKRGIRNEYGDKAAALVVEFGSDRMIEFTRSGWRNPAGHQRSNLQRVAYGIEEGSLIRASWDVLDRAQDSVAREQHLLDETEELSIRLLDKDDQWQEAWPPQDLGGQEEQDEAELPRAIELTLKLEDLGTLTWLFQTNP